jgi:hypothetical protein
MISVISFIAALAVNQLWNDSCVSTITKTIKHQNCITDSIMKICYRDELMSGLETESISKNEKVVYIKVEHECGGVILFDSSIVYVERKSDTTMTFQKKCGSLSEGNLYWSGESGPLSVTARCGGPDRRKLLMDNSKCANVGKIFGYSSISVGHRGNIWIAVTIENRTTLESLNISSVVNYNYINTVIKSNKFSVKVFETSHPR